jgi:predicted RNase H-like nuclease (RuvC/YqgF family)
MSTGVTGPWTEVGAAGVAIVTAVLTYFAATKANRRAMKVEQIRVDAEAYKRAQEIYDSVVAQLRTDNDRLTAKVDRLETQIERLEDTLRKHTVSLREQGVDIREQGEDIRANVVAIREKMDDTERRTHEEGN